MDEKCVNVEVKDLFNQYIYDIFNISKFFIN